jgi:hypothetical protein
LEIAKNPASVDSTNLSNLPFQVTPLYILSAIPEQELRATITDKRVHPNMSREDAEVNAGGPTYQLIRGPRIAAHNIPSAAASVSFERNILRAIA